MSDRITRKDVENALELLCKRAGWRVATSYKDVGGFQLSHDIGGWNVERVSGPTGGVCQPFGAKRRTNREMFDTLHFAADAFFESFGR